MTRDERTVDFFAGLACVGLVLFKLTTESRDSAIGLYIGLAAASVLAQASRLLDHTRGWLP